MKSNKLIFGSNSEIGSGVINSYKSDPNTELFLVDIGEDKYKGQFEHIYLKVDSYDKELQVIELIKEVLTYSKNNKIDEIICFIGTTEEPNLKLSEKSTSYINKIIQVNLSLVISLLARIEELMSNDCRICLTSSAHSIRTASYDPIYAASKAGLNAFIKSYAGSCLKRYTNIRINGVAPEGVNTSFIKNLFNSNEELSDYIKSRYMRRLLSIKEVSDTIEFLNSNKASGITGEVIVLGGFS